MLSRTLLVALCALGSAGLASACSEEKIAPAPSPGADASSGSGGSGTGGGTVTPAGERIRTVETRNPWGGSPGNLLVDGDFEFSVVLEGHQPQSGWYVFESSGLGVQQGYLRGETGGLCKSGLRCARVSPNQILFGQGTAAKDEGMIAGLWVKVPEGSTCDIVSFSVVRCDFVNNFGMDVPPVSLEPDADGWCRYRGGVDAQPSATCAYITNNLGPEQTAIVDHATLVPADGTSPLPTMKALSGARAAKARAIIDTIRKRRPIGAPPERKLPIGRE